jgi:hypothetical protein
MEFIFDKNFNNSKKYAKVVITEIPEKKRYDVLVNIFRNRTKAKSGNLNNLVQELLNSIKSEEYKEFIDNINKELLFCSDNDELRNFFSMFPPNKWNELIPLTKQKIENMIKKSLKNAKMEDVDYNYNESEYKCNEQGFLSTCAVQYIELFENKDEMLTILGKKLEDEDVDERNFVFEYFSQIIFGDQATKHPELKYGIKKSLEYFDKETYKFVSSNIELKELYKKELGEATFYFHDLSNKKTKENLMFIQDDQLPF